MRPSACLFVVAALLTGCGRDAVAPPAAADVAIHLLDLDGHPFDLWPPDRAAVTVVLFTRTDCPIANRYAPDVRRLYQTYHPRGVEFVLVYVDPRESADAIRRHL